MEKKNPIKILPLTPERWQDLESLFGEHGASAGCWCMFWRLEHAEFNKSKGEGTKAMLKGMAKRGEIPGLLAYVNGKPAGWCSVGPRENYRALEKSCIFKRVDEQPVWSIVCFFVDKAYREQGLMSELVHGAVSYPRNKGAKIVESYPLDMQSPKLAGKKLGSYHGYMGIASVSSKMVSWKLGVVLRHRLFCAI